MRILQLQDNDLNDLITLMDFAVKSQGLSVAAKATVLLSKIQAAQVVDEDAPNIRTESKPKKD